MRRRRPTQKPRFPLPYDNDVHGWVGGPPPRTPANARDPETARRLLDWLRLGDRGRSAVVVYPWARQACAPSESTAIVLCRLIYWAEPQPAPSDVQISKRAKQARFGKKPIVVKDMRGEFQGDGCYGIPASDREIARQTGLSTTSVNEAIRRLRGDQFDPKTRKWRKEVNTACIEIQGEARTMGRFIRVNFATVAAMYYRVTKDPVAKNYSSDGTSSLAWYESQTRDNATRAVTVLNMRLLKLTGDPLAARTLHQVLFRYSERGSKAVKHGWLHTTVKKLGAEVGVSEDAMKRVLERLAKKQLIHRATWRGLQSRLTARSLHTLLAPNMKTLLAKLRPKGISRD